MSGHPRSLLVPTLLTALALLSPTTATAKPKVDAARIDALLEHLATGKVALRDRAAQRLYLLGHPRGHAGVLALAAHRDPRRRARGVWALGVVRPKGARSLVTARLRDKEPGVRRAALSALISLRVARAHVQLRRALEDPAPSVRRRVLQLALRLPRHRLALLRRALDAKQAALRLLALRALDKLPKKEGLPLLRRTCRKGKPLLRLLAAKALQRRGLRRGTLTLATLARSRVDKGLRLQAIAALAASPDPIASRALRGLLRSRDRQLRQAAADALAQRRSRR